MCTVGQWCSNYICVECKSYCWIKSLCCHEELIYVSKYSPTDKFLFQNRENKVIAITKSSDFGHWCKVLSRCTCWVLKQFGSDSLLWQMDRLANSCSMGFIWSIHFDDHTCFRGLAQHTSENYTPVHVMPDEALLGFFFKLIQFIFLILQGYPMWMCFILTRINAPSFLYKEHKWNAVSITYNFTLCLFFSALKNILSLPFKGIVMHLGEHINLLSCWELQMQQRWIASWSVRGPWQGPSRSVADHRGVLACNQIPPYDVVKAAPIPLWASRGEAVIMPSVTAHFPWLDQIDQ